MSYDQAIAEAYASAPIDQRVLHTLELRNNSFVDEQNNPTAIRVVSGYDNLSLRLEADAPLNGGQYVNWLAFAFQLELNGFEEGQIPTIKITLSNISREITRYLELAIAELDPIYVTYRPYLESDPSGPQMDPPLHMTLSKVKVDVFQVTGTASLEDVHNWPFPNRKYLPTIFPGLVR